MMFTIKDGFITIVCPYCCNSKIVIQEGMLRNIKDEELFRHIDSLIVHMMDEHGSGKAFVAIERLIREMEEYERKRWPLRGIVIIKIEKKKPDQW